MVQLSKNLSLRKIWQHFVDISFSRVQLQESLNRYWASVMTTNGAEIAPTTPSTPTSKISFEGKAMDSFFFNPTLLTLALLALLRYLIYLPSASNFVFIFSRESHLLIKKQITSLCRRSHLSGVIATTKRTGIDFAKYLPQL